MEYKPFTLPFTAKIPEKVIYGSTGMCAKCFSMWIEGSGCTNVKCPEIVYRDLNESLELFD